MKKGNRFSHFTGIIISITIIITSGFYVLPISGQSYSYQNTHPTPFSEINEVWSENLLYNKMPIAKKSDGTVLTPFTNWGHPQSNITDGTTATSLWNANNGSTMCFDLGEKCEITRFYIFTTTYYSIKSYELYVGNSQTNLFSSDNYVLTGSNLNGNSPQNDAYFFAQDKPTGSFLGIKITEVGYQYQQNPYTAICEIAAFGNKFNYTYTQSIPASFASSGVDFTKNLLYTKLPEAYSSDGSQLQFITSGETLPPSNICDGTASPSVWNADPGSTLIFDMGAVYDISQYYMFTVAARAISGYDLYIGIEKDTLFTQNNYVLSGSNIANGSVHHEKYEFSDVLPTGRFLGVKITSLGVAAEDGYTGIAEIAAFGVQTKRVFLTEAKSAVLNNEAFLQQKINQYDYNNDNDVDITDLVLIKNYMENEIEQGKKSCTVTVDSTKILNNDYYGVGVNSIPVTEMKNNVAYGNNKSYFELEKKRILDINPAMVRLWTQVDWFVTERDKVSNGGTGLDYYSEKYDFESPQMQCLYDYLDIYEKTKSEIIIVASWKVGSEIQQWYSIEGVKNPESSAPRNPEACAKAYAALVRYLIDVKGYTGIKWISIANEPNYNDFSTISADSYGYYIQTLTAFRNIFTQRNINIQFFGPDTSENNLSANTFMYRSSTANSSLFDALSCHTYFNSVNSASSYISQLKSLAYTKKLFVGEFGRQIGTINYSASLTGEIITGAAQGVSGHLLWMLNDCYGEDPFPLSKNTIGGAMGIWYPPQDNLTVKDSYYEIGLLSNYIPRHSKLVSTHVFGNNINTDKIRSAAFITNDGDITVVVETDYCVAEKLNLIINNFSGTLYKHIYTQNKMANDALGIIPVSTETFNFNNGLTDNNTINSQRTVIVYTTIPDKPQVNMESVSRVVRKGAYINLSASVNKTSDITWSILSGSGNISQDGIYTAIGSQVLVGDVVAVKAALKSNPDCYGITLVTIK